MESIIHFSLHLTKIKLVLERLIKIVEWTPEELTSVNEFYLSAVGTIDSFGRERQVSPYDNRIFTPTGKLLVEISKGWPQELEYGWINRRVVSIFDVEDVTSDDKSIINIIFIFTDSVVITRPIEPVSMTSDSGIHKPSIADMLMHSMINSMPLINVPDLVVVGWAPIEDVHFANYGSPMNLAMYITGNGLKLNTTTPAEGAAASQNPSTSTPAYSSIHRLMKKQSYSSHGPAAATGPQPKAFTNLKIFRLIRPGIDADIVANYISKAKIMNKTQPFHLFQSCQPNLTTFATVHEYQGYRLESRKCPIAIFANLKISPSLLDSYNLIACIGVQIYNSNLVLIRVVSKLGYETKKVVRKENFAVNISSHIARIYSLYFSSTNEYATEMIVQNNTELSEYLVKFATTECKPAPAPGPKRGHTSGINRTPAVNRLTIAEAPEQPEQAPASRPQSQPVMPRVQSMLQPETPKPLPKTRQQPVTPVQNNAQYRHSTPPAPVTAAGPAPAVIRNPKVRPASLAIPPTESKRWSLKKRVSASSLLSRFTHKSSQETIRSSPTPQTPQGSVFTSNSTLPSPATMKATNSNLSSPGIFSHSTTTPVISNQSSASVATVTPAVVSVPPQQTAKRKSSFSFLRRSSGSKSAASPKSEKRHSSLSPRNSDVYSISDAASSSNSIPTITTSSPPNPPRSVTPTTGLEASPGASARHSYPSVTGAASSVIQNLRRKKSFMIPSSPAIPEEPFDFSEDAGGVGILPKPYRNSTPNTLQHQAMIVTRKPSSFLRYSDSALSAPPPTPPAPAVSPPAPEPAHSSITVPISSANLATIASSQGLQAKDPVLLQSDLMARPVASEETQASAPTTPNHRRLDSLRESPFTPGAAGVKLIGSEDTDMEESDDEKENISTGTVINNSHASSQEDSSMFTSAIQPAAQSSMILDEDISMVGTGQTSSAPKSPFRIDRVATQMSIHSQHSVEEPSHASHARQSSYASHASMPSNASSLISLSKNYRLGGPQLQQEFQFNPRSGSSASSSGSSGSSRKRRERYNKAHHHAGTSMSSSSGSNSFSDANSAHHHRQHHHSYSISMSTSGGRSISVAETESTFDNGSVQNWYNDLHRQSLENASLDSYDINFVPGIDSNETTFDDDLDDFSDSIENITRFIDEPGFIDFPAAHHDGMTISSPDHPEYYNSADVDMPNSMPHAHMSMTGGQSPHSIELRKKQSFASSFEYSTSNSPRSPAPPVPSMPAMTEGAMITAMSVTTTTTTTTTTAKLVSSASSTSSGKPVSRSESGYSMILSDDFSYLGKLVSVNESDDSGFLGNTSNILPPSVSMSSALSGKRDGLSPSSSLYPDLRDSSLIFLSKFIDADESQGNSWFLELASSHSSKSVHSRYSVSSLATSSSLRNLQNVKQPQLQAPVSKSSSSSSNDNSELVLKRDGSFSSLLNVRPASYVSSAGTFSDDGWSDVHTSRPASRYVGHSSGNGEMTVGGSRPVSQYATVSHSDSLLLDKPMRTSSVRNSIVTEPTLVLDTAPYDESMSTIGGAEDAEEAEEGNSGDTIASGSLENAVTPTMVQGTSEPITTDASEVCASTPELPLTRDDASSIDLPETGSSLRSIVLHRHSGAHSMNTPLLYADSAASTSPMTSTIGAVGGIHTTSSHGGSHMREMSLASLDSTSMSTNPMSAFGIRSENFTVFETSHCSTEDSVCGVDGDASRVLHYSNSFGGNILPDDDEDGNAQSVSRSESYSTEKNSQEVDEDERFEHHSVLQTAQDTTFGVRRVSSKPQAVLTPFVLEKERSGRETAAARYSSGSSGAETTRVSSGQGLSYDADGDVSNSFSGSGDSSSSSSDNSRRKSSGNIESQVITSSRGSRRSSTKKSQEYMLSTFDSLSNMNIGELELRSLLLSIESLINEEFASLMTASASSGSGDGPSMPLAVVMSPFTTAQRKQILRQLERVNDTVFKLYERTRSLPPLTGALEARDAQRVINVEHANRALVMECAWVLIGIQQAYRAFEHKHAALYKGYANILSTAAGAAVNSSHVNMSEKYRTIVQQFFSLEWARRTTMHDKLGDSQLPRKLWSV